MLYRSVKVILFVLLLLVLAQPSVIGSGQNAAKYCIALGRDPGPQGEGGSAPPLLTFIDPWTGALKHEDSSVSVQDSIQQPKVLFFRPSPDGKYSVSYFDDGRLVMDTNATGQRTVLADQRVQDFHWLESGKRYTYIVGDKPAFMVIANLDGTNNRRMDFPASEIGITQIIWSPNDRYVAYTTGYPTWDNPSPPASVVIRSTDDGSLISEIPGHFVDYYGYKQWSPISDAIAVLQYDSVVSSDQQIPSKISMWLFYPHNGLSKKIPFPENAYLYDVITWSPDGRFMEATVHNTNDTSKTKRGAAIYDTQSNVVSLRDVYGSWSSDSSSLISLIGPSGDEQLVSDNFLTHEIKVLLANIVLVQNLWVTDHMLVVQREDGKFVIRYMDFNGEHRVTLAEDASTLPIASSGGQTVIHWALNYQVIVLTWRKANDLYFTMLHVDGSHMQTVAADTSSIPIMFDGYGWNKLSFIAHRASGDTLETLDADSGIIHKISPEYPAIGRLGTADYLNYVYFRWKTATDTGIDVYDVDTRNKLVTFPGTADLDSNESVTLSPDKKTFILIGGNKNDRYIALAAAQGKWSKIIKKNYVYTSGDSDMQDVLVWSPDNQLFFYKYLTNGRPFIDIMTAEGQLVRTVPIKGFILEAWQPCR